MPSPYTRLSEWMLIALKQRVEQEFGKSIFTKPDCDLLSDQILVQTGKFTSTNTLRRLFDLISSPSSPSLETLNTLSNYCGFKSFHEFEQCLRHKSEDSNNTLSIEALNELHKSLGDSYQFSETLNWLLQLGFRDNNVPFLKTFFDLDAFKSKPDYTQNELKKSLTTFGVELRANPKISEVLVNHYASNPVAQALYFEHFVDYDFLTTRHHNAIHLYSQKRTDNEAQLFSLCLLFLHSFLLRDRTSCSDLLKRINSIELSNELHPFPAGRKMACNVLFQKFYAGGVKRDLIDEIFLIENAMPRNGSIGRDVPSYQMQLVEAFTWAGLYNEALRMTQIAFDSYTCQISDKNKCAISHLRMYQAKSLLESNRVEEAIQTFEGINKSDFEVHVKNFSLMNYFKISSDIQKLIDPKLASSLKRSALEIATKHQFKFFETIYA